VIWNWRNQIWSERIADQSNGEVLHSGCPLRQGHAGAGQRDQGGAGGQRRHGEDRGTEEGHHAPPQRRNHSTALHHHHPLRPPLRGPHHPEAPPPLPRDH